MKKPIVVMSNKSAQIIKRIETEDLPINELFTRYVELYKEYEATKHLDSNGIHMFEDD